MRTKLASAARWISGSRSGAELSRACAEDRRRSVSSLAIPLTKTLSFHSVGELGCGQSVDTPVELRVIPSECLIAIKLHRCARNRQVGSHSRRPSSEVCGSALPGVGLVHAYPCFSTACPGLGVALLSCIPVILIA